LLAGPDVPEPVKQDIFLGDFPEMTEKGTFIINGTERVVVSQLIRSPGVYFEAPADRATRRALAMANLSLTAARGWNLKPAKSDYIILKFNRKRTVPITVFLRALAAVDDGMLDSPLKHGTDEEIIRSSAMWTTTPSACILPRRSPGTGMGLERWPDNCRSRPD
jgi:DNA-directed RNA polymerase subunit beta